MRIHALFLLLFALPAGAQEPRLSDSQVLAMKSARARAEHEAAPLAAKLAATAVRIYENMLSDKEDERLGATLRKELKTIAGKLLETKGQSIRDMVAVLTPEQKQFVHAEMRKPGAPGDLSELIVKLFHVPGR